MRLKSYPEKDGKRVWLSWEEFQMLVNEAEDVRQRVAFKAGGESGMRREEAAEEIQPGNIVGTPGNYRLRIWEDAAKNDEYREAPLSDEMVAEIQSIADLRGLADDKSVLDVQGKQLYRWVKRAGARLYDRTGDEGWQYLDYHDLRRSWGVNMLEYGVMPTVVFEWGGWQSFAVFKQNYMNELSPQGLKRERQKAPHLAARDTDIDLDDPSVHMTPAVNTGFQGDSHAPPGGGRYR